MSNCDHVWAIEGSGAEARPRQCLNCGKRFAAEVAAERIRSHAKALVEAESLRARLQAAEAALVDADKCRERCDVAADLEEALDKLASLRTDLTAARALLREVYESQPAACVGGGATLPCGSCLWCRVRAGLEGK